MVVNRPIVTGGPGNGDGSGGWGDKGQNSHGHGGWEARGRETFDDWHRRAHDEAAPSKPDDPAPPTSTGVA